jgi:hypothetical protein
VEMKTIKGLVGTLISLDIDPNIHGLPYLCLSVGHPRIIGTAYLDLNQTKELINELQNRIKHLDYKDSIEPAELERRKAIRE